MTYPVCPCDGAAIAPPVNLPQLSHISYRVGRYVDFRRAVLTPLLEPAVPAPLPVEQTLSVNGVPVWRTDGPGDLAVMIAEWFAYVADVLTFYNERIANQDYLRTADLPESVNNLIALLGYRPRPAIGAIGNLAALITAGPSFGGQGVVLPRGLQFQSKPAPGQAPQTFELNANTKIGAPDRIAAEPAPTLLGSVSAPPIWHYSPYHDRFYARKFMFQGSKTFVDKNSSMFQVGDTIEDQNSLLLRGAVTTVKSGDLLLLRARDGSGGPWLASVATATSGPAPSGGGQQTNLTVTWTGTGAPPSTLAAAQASLESPAQSSGVWTFNGTAISGTSVQLAGLVRDIHPGDWVLLSASSGSPDPVLMQVSGAAEVITDANNPPIAPGTTGALPMPHTVLTIDGLSGWHNAKGVTVRFGWVPVGTLLNQPFTAWSGSPTSVVSSGAQAFPAMADQPILLQDSTGLGISAKGSSGGDANLTVSSLLVPVPSLQPPFLVLPNVLAVSRGKTVTNEVLGSGDTTNPAQDFQLSQSPVTYLAKGTGYSSTIALTVNGTPWTEVPSFYGQPANATVFVTREDNSGNTHVMFGDGVNGARLPTGSNNVVATYRVGAGAASPAAGKLTVIAKSYPGLRAVLNPVAVGGGSDADPPNQIRRYAPRSVLAFGRAVSVFDYAALAAQATGVTRAQAVWAWNDAQQRSVVTVYVGDDSAAAASAKAALTAERDPNRPVVVVQATAIAVALNITLLATPGMDPTAGVLATLTDTQTGLFGSWTLGVGQTVFDSQIEAAVLAVPGAVAIIAAVFYADNVIDPGPLHIPGEGAFYTLDPADINLTMEPDPNGG